MKISKKTLFALFSASLITSVMAADEYKTPDVVMKNVEPVESSKTLALDDKFKVESAVEEGRRLASEDAKEEEVREPSSVKKPIDEEKMAEVPKFWNHKVKDTDY